MRRGLVIAALVVALDQLTKWGVIELLFNTRRHLRLTDFFNLVLAFNRGVSFSILDSDSTLMPWVLTMFALLVVVVLVLWLKRGVRPWLQAALGLVIGGAIGNVVDRVRFGAVTDFLDFHVGDAHWPAFNLADSAITVGVALLFIDALATRRESNK